ncbi:transposase [Ruthenibacterium lactatiformans]|jgi:transposase-like protein|uniref:transposase n=1 Tax=Ruthenibacterium lactatiformans TaxID=1550024 RepID=UPI002666DECA|nr:transposase [Ruthenibacterium lactatiformans]
MVFFLNAIHYHVRNKGQIVKKAVYIVIGINLDGGKDVLGMWVGENESAKFWTTVLNSLCNHGGEDIFIACTDNLAGPSMLSFLRPRPSVHSFPPALPQFWKFEVVRLEHFPVAKV